MGCGARWWCDCPLGCESWGWTAAWVMAPPHYSSASPPQPTNTAPLRVFSGAPRSTEPARAAAAPRAQPGFPHTAMPAVARCGAHAFSLRRSRGRSYLEVRASGSDVSMVVPCRAGSGDSNTSVVSSAAVMRVTISRGVRRSAAIAHACAPPGESAPGDTQTEFVNVRDCRAGPAAVVEPRADPEGPGWGNRQSEATPGITVRGRVGVLAGG
jgi:hypothetical protein